MGETWPLELCSNQLAGFQEARMSSSRLIMVVGNDGVAEVEIIGSIDLSLEGEGAGVILPVKEAGMEGWGNFSRHGLEGGEDKGIRGRGSCQLSQKGGVNEFDEKRVQEEGDRGIVVIISSRKEIGMAREGVEGREEATGNMDYFEVKICEVTWRWYRFWG